MKRKLVGSLKVEFSKKGECFSSNQKKKKEIDKKKIGCFNCEIFEHYAYECWHGKRKKAQNNEKKNAHMAQDEDDSYFYPLELMVVTYERNPMCENWYLDIGCSNHMVRHKEWMAKLDRSKKTNVRRMIETNLVVECMGNNVIIRKDDKIL